LVATTELISSGKQQEKKGATPDFEMTASYIEACSCDMFCPCYFNTAFHESYEHGRESQRRTLLPRQPRSQSGQGHYKNIKLDGAKVWIATD